MGFFHVWYGDTRLLLQDISLLQYGEQQCDPGYGYGPCIRNFYFLHYVYSGKGWLLAEGKRYEIGPGQCFLIYPGQMAYYEADREEPWVYRWFEVSGALCGELLTESGFSRECPVITDATGTIGKAVTALMKVGGSSVSAAMGRLWDILHCMAGEEGRGGAKAAGTEYVRKCEAYIRRNLHGKIRVGELATHVGIDRSYLCRIFKEQKGISPQQYVLKLKMETAAGLLKRKEISVKEVALCVGYEDPLEFSKQFRRHFLVSPSRWREKAFYEQSVKM